MREEQLLELIGRTYDASLDPKGWVAFVEGLEQALGGAAVALAVPFPRPDQPGRFVAPSFDPAYVEAYREQYLPLDPFASYVERLAVGSFVFGQRCVPEAKLERTTFYREWMAPQGLLPGPSLGGVIDRTATDGTIAIAAFRRRGTRCWGRAEQRLGELLMPHLRRAVQICRLTARLGGEGEALTTVFDRLSMALILVDLGGHVRATNRAADVLLARRDGLTLDRDGLHAAGPEETLALKRLLAEAAQTSAGAGLGASGGLCLPRPSGRRSLNALVTPIRTDGAELVTERAVAALFVSDPEESAEPPAELVRRFYDLTSAEAALACELARGHSLDEAGKRLGITRETARTNLKHVFCKTDTHRQAALVRLLLTSPAQLRPEESEE